MLYFAIKPETVEALKDLDHAPPGVRLFSEFFKYALGSSFGKACGGRGRVWCGVKCRVRVAADRGFRNDTG